LLWSVLHTRFVPASGSSASVMKPVTGSKTIPEEVLNWLVRRADWRFLLPNPRPGKSVSFASGLLGEAVGLISECLVDAGVDPQGDCDLAVAIDPDNTTLRAAWARLCPGGSCYTEWYSPLTGGLKRIRRRLEAAGFTDVVCYWCWPRPFLSRAQHWLPLEAPGALRHFLHKRAPARNPVHRILRAAWLVAFRAGLSVPLGAIARKPASLTAGRQRRTAGRMRSADRRPLQPSGTIPDYLRSTIRTHWQSWGLGPPPDNFSSLMLTGGGRSWSKVVLLVFAEPNPYPQMVIKLPRVPGAASGLTTEATALRAIQSRRPGGVSGVPEVLFCQEHAGLLTVGETVVAGQPVSTQVRRSNFRDLALKATDWLSELAGHSEVCSPALWWDRLVEPVLAEFGEVLGPSGDRGMLRETRDRLSTLGALPLVCEHRDFSPWNLLVTPDGQLGVVDWDSAELQGLPAQDLIYFLTLLAFHLHGAWNRESYRATRDPSTFTGSVLSECVARYACRTGLDAAAIGPLRLFAWVRHALWDPKLFLSLWEEELRHEPPTTPTPGAPRASQQVRHRRAM
jgi:Phosphotransferase enzyme family